MTDAAAEAADTDLGRWRGAFELRDGVVYWRADPTRSEAWNAAWAGKALGERVRLGGRKLAVSRIAEGLRTGRVPSEAASRFKSAIDWDSRGGLHVGTGPLDRALDNACAVTGLRRSALTVLSKHVDPFLLDSARGHAEGRWFAEQLERLGGGRRLHLRGIHYLLASVASIVTPSGRPYVNDFACWKWLAGRAAKAARWLEYVQFDEIEDSRNEARYHRVAAHSHPFWSAGSGLVGLHQLPTFGPPRVWLLGFEPHQKYAFAIFGEKSSLAPLLDAAAHQYGADLYIGSGEISDTLIFDIAQRAHADGRTLVCFTATDFDPSGRQMATSISRKLRALKILKFPDLEYRVVEIALTLEQARRLDLPSTPLKPTEQRAANWIGRFGREQTEIDALMALHPGALEAEIRRAFAPYWDETLRARAAEIRANWEAEAQAALDAQIGEGQVDDWQERFENALAEIQTVHEEQHEAARGLRLTRPDLPEADLGDEPDNAVASSDMSFAKESRVLRARKTFEDEDGSEDEEEGE